jgi:hypothetical protein
MEKMWREWISNMMNKDLKTWVIGGVVAIFVMSIGRTLLFDSIFMSAEHKVVGMIENEADAIQKSREEAEERDKQVDASFDRIMNREFN